MRMIGTLLALALVACDDHGHDDDGHASPTEEACEHMKDGPARPVTAAAEREGAPAAAFEHARADITLATVEGGNGGYVSFPADEATDYVFYLSAAVPFAVFDATGAAIELEASEPVTACGEVAIAHTVPLDVGTVFLYFGPTEATTVSLVFEHADDDHHHDD